MVVVLLLVLDRRRLRTVGFRVLVAVVVLITCRRIRRLEQLVERRRGSGRLRYALAGHVVSLLGKHRARRSRHAHHRFGVSVPELAEAVGLGVAVGVVLLIRGRRMMAEIVPEAARRRRRIAILVGRRLLEIVGFRHVAIARRLVAVLRSTVRRAAAVAATHAVVIVVIDWHLLLLLLLLFTFGRFGRQPAHGRPAFVAAILETGHVDQRPVLVAIVHVAARLVFRVRSSHVRRYRQQNVCQHPAAATRQRQRT